MVIIKYERLLNTKLISDLESGFQYLFRLIASCPCLETTTIASVTKKPDRFAIATADVTIQINPVPILKELKVNIQNNFTGIYLYMHAIKVYSFLLNIL